MLLGEKCHTYNIWKKKKNNEIWSYKNKSSYKNCTSYLLGKIVLFGNTTAIKNNIFQLIDSNNQTKILRSLTLMVLDKPERQTEYNEKCSNSCLSCKHRKTFPLTIEPPTAS